jgi:hypothetical protein
MVYEPKNKIRTHKPILVIKLKKGWSCGRGVDGLRVRRSQQLGAFGFSPRLHRRGANVAHAANAQENSHQILVFRDVHDHDEIPFSSRVVKLHFPASFLNHAASILDSLRRFGHFLDALLSPVSKNDKTRQNFHRNNTRKPKYKR